MRTRRITAALLASLLLFAAYRLFDLTRTGEMIWFVIERHAVLTEDGNAFEGWLHRDWTGEVVLITRDKLARRESYLIAPISNPAKAYVDDCGNWTAPHLPLFPFPVLTSDALVCLGWDPENLGKRTLRNHKVGLGIRSLDFVAEDGKSIKARW